MAGKEKRQETPSIRKRKSNYEKSRSEENKRPKGSKNSRLLEPYRIGTSSWIRKSINTYALEHLLVSSAFGLLECLPSFVLFYYLDALLNCLFYHTVYRPDSLKFSVCYYLQSCRHGFDTFYGRACFVHHFLFDWR